MPKIYMPDVDVVVAAKERIRPHFQNGDFIVVSVSGGKDSTVAMELALEVAREENALPLNVQTRDEEIMPPGTYEYLERCYHRDEINFRWHIAGQPIENAFNRYAPYWWVFDPDERDKWVRQPPEFATWVDTLDINLLVSKARYGVPDEQRLVVITGIRADESLTRQIRIASTSGALTKRMNAGGAYTLAPIYDWKTNDIWKYIGDNNLDYNKAYNDFYRS